jgi:hypothetical protein
MILVHLGYHAFLMINQFVYNSYNFKLEPINILIYLARTSQPKLTNHSGKERDEVKFRSITQVFKGYQNRLINRPTICRA